MSSEFLSVTLTLLERTYAYVSKHIYIYKYILNIYALIMDTIVKLKVSSKEMGQ